MTGVVLLCVLAAAATASTVVPLGLKQISVRAHRLTIGRIERLTSYQDPASGRILSRVDVVESAALPGGAAGAFSFEMIGGTAGGLTQWIAGFPRLQPGDRVVLFLNRDTTGPLGPTVGLWQGVFFIETDPATGLDTLRNHRRQPILELRGDDFVVEESPPGRVNAVSARRLTLDEFLERVAGFRGALPGAAARR